MSHRSKRLAAAVLLSMPALAFAQQEAPMASAPVDVPKHKCGTAPEVPGMTVGQDRMVKQRFEREMKEYQGCMKSYVAERNAHAKANFDAANKAIDEYNNAMKALNEARKSQ